MVDPRVAALAANVERVIHGKPESVRLLVTALLAQGHVLIEDIPGVGKTALARALAKSISATFRRIQFTPDLLPGDITGVGVYQPAQGTFVFQPGPLFAHVVLADEINRATPKTQSALLEAMNERSVSVGPVDPSGESMLERRDMQGSIRRTGSLRGLPPQTSCAASPEIPDPGRDRFARRPQVLPRFPATVTVQVTLDIPRRHCIIGVE